MLLLLIRAVGFSLKYYYLPRLHDDNSINNIRMSGKKYNNIFNRHGRRRVSKMYY